MTSRDARRPDAPASVTGVILAGGQARRMGGVDKGLELLDGQPMVARVLSRLAPQVAEVLINANQNFERYGEFGYRVIPDLIGGYAGPLAGLHRGLTEAAYALVVTVPCDSPFLPRDLVSRLREPLQRAEVDLAVARTGDQPHPVFCITRRRLLPHLEAYLRAGGRKIDAWYATLNVVEVRFDDQIDAFSNINTREELRSVQGMAAP